MSITTRLWERLWERHRACVRAGAKLNVTPSAPFDRRGLQWRECSDEKGGIFKLPGLSVHKFRLRGLRQKKRAPLHVHSLADLTLELRLPLWLAFRLDCDGRMKFLETSHRSHLRRTLTLPVLQVLASKADVP